MEKVLNEDNFYTLRVSMNLGQAYYESRRLEYSLEPAEKILKIWQVIDEDKDETILSIMGGVVGLCYGQGRYKMAAQMQTKVVTKSKALLGTEHRDTL